MLLVVKMSRTSRLVLINALGLNRGGRNVQNSQRHVASVIIRPVAGHFSSEGEY
jgi:hypothetical protein